MRALLLAALLALPAAAQAPEADPWSFVLLGHPRGGPDNGIFPRERLDEAIAEINRLRPDFTVLLGDIVWGDFERAGARRELVDADWDEVARIWSRLEAPWYAVPGNHDVWDPVTRDLWIERFGALQRAFEHKGSRFLLVNSCWTPEGDTGSVPGESIRGAPLPPERVAWIGDELAASAGAAHVFVLQHHVLWWDADAPWWSDVHPLLVQSPAPVRLVAAGDLGPLKFGHLERDGVDYVQTSIELNEPPLVMKRNREGTRVLTQQPDTFLLVTVEGPDVRLELRTLGAFSSGHFTPDEYREVNEHDAGSFQRKVYKRMNTPARVVRWLWILCGAALVGGLVVGAGLGWLAGRRRRAGAA